MTLSTACPKPEKTPKKPRKALQRTSWKVSQKPPKPIQKVNVERTRKRNKQNAKRFSTPEYIAAKALANTRSGGRCEVRHMYDANYVRIGVLLPGESIPKAAASVVRCSVTEDLDFHETKYASKTGVIRSAKGCMACQWDHQYIEETRHSTRSARRKVAGL